MNTDLIRIITAGGTIDKIYFDAKSEYQVGEPNIRCVLEDMKVGFPYVVESVLRKDSLEITDDDRETLAKAIASGTATRIVITHGTDTMVQTANYLAAHAAATGKVIVLTGALAPAMFKTSDAVFNIGCAVAAAQTLTSGVYITMNGIVFLHDNVRKNLDKGYFEALT